MFGKRGSVHCYAQLTGIEFNTCKNAINLYRYNKKVFVAPPWKEIYTTDSERKMNFEGTLLFHTYLIEVYTSFGYEVVEVPTGSVDTRADFLIRNFQD